MISIEEFRERLLSNELDGLLDDVILAEGALHVSNENIARITSALAQKFGVDHNRIFLRIIGSAKLGFSIIEKRAHGEVVSARYRPFSPSSDIDIVVICKEIFDLVWNDLAAHALRETRLPWNSERLGDYLVCGWLRPDYFPTAVRLRYCDDWWDVFNGLSADARFGRRRIRGGLYHSIEQARMYLLRGLKDCMRAEAIQV